ncbi:ParB N-terminal domain-containing protein [Spirosoma pollinicola]|uniref:ParB/Sulfiredoxin domain-containing protein n=1 Tax=Spirosoma pollinicola TaxID=2057025 RepID=A0A2K8Z8B2_9BACT|nr:hypothetical protein [Spirosoma pollinicola]AUD06101.1 hypothetical protein CWM47_32210 [Spirosoma pollinicola]
MKKDFMNSMKEKTSTLRPSLLSTEENIKGQILVLDNLRELIPPLKVDEYDQLQQNILKYGVKDPLMVWETTSTIAQINGDNNPVFVLIDGHNRYKICQKFNLDYRINIIRFSTLDEVKDYMIDYQLGRRNLSAEQTSYLRGLRYLQQKSMRGGNKISDHSQADVSVALGKEYGVSSRTIKRDGDYAASLDKLSPDLKKEILSGKQKLPKSTIKAVAKSDKPVENIEELAEERVGNTTVSESLVKPKAKKGRATTLENEIRKLISVDLTYEACEVLIKKANQLIELLRPK